MTQVAMDRPVLTETPTAPRRIRRAAITGLALAALAALVAVVGLGVFAQERWTATLLVVGTQNAGDPVRNAGTYAAVIGSDQAVTSAVAAASGLPEDTVQTDLSASGVQETAVVEVSFTAPSADQAIAGLRGVQDGLAVVTSQNGSLPGVIFRTVRSPGDAVLTSSPWASTIAAAALAGFVLGFLISWVWPSAASRRNREFG